MLCSSGQKYLLEISGRAFAAYSSPPSQSILLHQHGPAARHSASVWSIQNAQLACQDEDLRPISLSTHELVPDVCARARGS